MSARAKADTVGKSFLFAFRGVGLAWSQERNFRVQTVYALLMLVVLMWLRPPLILCALNLLSAGLLLSAEMANSALERAVDLACPETHPVAGQAKDLAAGAVMLVSFCSAALLLFTVFLQVSGQATLGFGLVLAGLIAFREGLKR